MSTRSIHSRAQDRFGWLWLLIGASLLPFAYFRTIWPIAAWLAPLFLMRFTRTRPLALGVLLVALAEGIGAWVGLRDGYIPAPLGTPPGPVQLFGAALYALLFSVPFALDRLLSGRLPGFLRTLVYPAAAVTIDYAMVMEPYHSNFGSPAYTQYGNLPLMQLISVTGMWGLTFLVSWLAPVANEIWERGTSPRVLRYSLLPFASVLGVVLVYGSARVTFTPGGPLVRVAGLTPDRTLYLRDPNGEEIFWPDVEAIARSSDAERAQWRKPWLKVTDDLLARSRQEARAGAKIISWGEESAFLLAEDVPTVLEQSRSLARSEGIYLQIAIQPILRSRDFPFAENRAVLIDPSGGVVWDYHKAYPIPGAETLDYDGGPPTVPFTDTPYGRLAGLICYDMDFVPYMRQAGLAQAGLVLAAANDWLAIENDHTHIAVYRAVENGFAMMRPDAKGVSLAVDPLGRELVSGEYFSTDRLDVVAMMPVQAVPTLYSRIGDVFAWLSIAALVGLVARAVFGRRTAPAILSTSERGHAVPAAF
jgi:apolipoprotein N-acyltransferase